MIKDKFHYSMKTKDWYWNMNNIIINFRRRGEANDMYLIHMNEKCRIDRTGPDSRVWRWK